MLYYVPGLSQVYVLRTAALRALRASRRLARRGSLGYRASGYIRLYVGSASERQAWRGPSEDICCSPQRQQPITGGHFRGARQAHRFDICWLGSGDKTAVRYVRPPHAWPPTCGAGRSADKPGLLLKSKPSGLRWMFRVLPMNPRRC